MPSFVGRGAELTRLEAALADASAGRGRLVLVSGEPGIGKTRLADELCARVGNHARVVWGRCWEAGGAPAFWPWIEILRPLVADTDATTLNDILGADATLLGAIVPEVRARLPGIAETAPPSENARFSLFDATSRFLRAAATRTPLVLVLDDLHAADEPSLHLLQFVARGLRGARVLLVGTHRDADANLGPEKALLLGTIAREAEKLPLRRLRDHEVLELITSISGVVPSSDVVHAVLGATEGTPLFVSEVATLALPGASAEGIAIPDGLGTAIAAHLARMSERTREVLRFASLIGRDFEPAVLAALLDRGGSSSDDLSDRLREAERAGLVVDLRSNPPRHRFSHFLIRETIYRDVSRSERDTLHGLIGRILDSRPHGPAEQAEIAHHFLNAGPEAAADAAIHARRAGEHALDVFAHEQAAQHFRQALGALATGDGAPTRAQIELLLALAEVHQRAGDRTHANQVSEQAARFARDIGDAELLATAALRRGAEFTFGSVDPVLVDLLQAARAQIGEKSALGARVLARLAAARQPAPDPEEPLALARRAIALARKVADKRTLAAVLRDARSAYLPLDDLESRIELDLETLRLSQEAGASVDAAHAHRRLTTDRLEQGEIAVALGHIEQYERIVDEIRQPHRKWWSLASRASIETLRGNFERAQALLDEAERAAGDRADPSIQSYIGTQRLTWIWASRRDELLARADETVGRMAAEHPSPSIEMFRTLVRARMGDREFVRSRWNGPGTFSDHPRFAGQGQLGEMAIQVGDRTGMAVLYERLEPWRNLYSAHLFLEGSHARPLAILAHALGRIDDARRHFETAIAADERIGARPWVAHSLFAYARLLAETRNPADLRRAEELFDRARAIAAELGMPGLLAAIGRDEAETARLPATPPRHSSESAAHPLADAFQLEGEYWTLRFEDQIYRLRDNKGLQLVAYLVKNAGREFHVLHLTGIAEGSTGSGELLESAVPAGPDRAARTAYQARLAELQSELDDAERDADLGRSERLREELEQLTHELARGLGLGGRERGAGGSVERARVNVQRRISDAVKKIEAACPALGRHLSQAIRTGTYCSYVASL